MTTIKAVIFDIGNVLIQWQPEDYYAARFGQSHSDAFFAEVPIMARHFETDAGRNFYEMVETTAKDFPDWKDEITIWADDWTEFAKEVITESVQSLRGLRAAGVPVFALSNFGVENFAVSEKQHDFLGEFDRRYISGALKLVKPDAAIYAHVEDDTGLKGPELLFVDDRLDNIEAALARGWKAHQFDDPKAWLARLADEGLLPA